MELEQLVTEHDELDRQATESSNALNHLCKDHTNAMGLVDDDFRLTIEYRIKRDEFNRAFKKLREFNQQANKNKELRKFLDERSRSHRFHSA